MSSDIDAWPDGPQHDLVMVDVEALGLEPGSVVLSIGAVKFGADGTGQELHVRIDIESCQEAGLGIDADTLKWWLDQDGEAREELHGDTDLETALKRLSSFCDGVSEVWANSPACDCVLIESAYKAVGLECPWTYDRRRDYRTLRSVTPPVDTELEGTAHNALDDARYQARAEAEALRGLQL